MKDENADKHKDLIFVGGSPRSGTTLIQDILDSHPNIAGGPEFDRTPDIVKLRNKFYDSITRGRIDIYCSKNDVDREVKKLLLNLLLPFTERQEAMLLSEKTPSNILFFEDLIEIFPNSYFIFVLRDPRAIVSSMLDVGKRAKKRGIHSPRYTKNIKLACKMAKKHIRRGFEAYNKYPDKILLVKYEDILFEPEKETKRIVNYLDIDWSEDMLYPGKKEHVRPKEGHKGWGTELTGKNIDESGAYKWKKRLSDFEKIYINKKFKDMNFVKEIGYDLSNSDMSRSYKNLLLLKAKIYNHYEFLKQRYKNMINRFKRVVE